MIIHPLLLTHVVSETDGCQRALAQAYSPRFGYPTAPRWRIVMGNIKQRDQAGFLFIAAREHVAFHAQMCGHQ